VDTLANGSYTVKVGFKDAYDAGEGEDTFTVDRVSPSVKAVNITGAVPKIFKYKASGVGNSLPLTAQVTAADGADTSVAWSVEGPATVDKDGRVTFTGAEGIVMVTAISGFDESVKSRPVAIRVAKNVTGIRTPLKAYFVKRGGSLTIPLALDDSSKKGLITPIHTALTFKSSNAKALTVTKAGKGFVKIKASSNVKKATKVRLSVTAASGKKKTVTVYVVPKSAKAKKLRVTGYKTKMKVGQTRQLKVSVSPAKATGISVTYKSSKQSGLHVDKAGKIIALAKGRYTVTVKAGGKKVKTKKIIVR
jgi:uncharacterized protein YjdB